MPARSSVLVLCVVAVLAGACGGGAPEDTSPTPSAGAEAALAEALRIDAAVDVALAGDDFAAVDEEPASVAVGDVVRTDDAGFAEIAYFDGSLVRLDVDTSLEIVALSDEFGDAEIVTRMDLGRTWHRVADDVPDRDYVVETNVATATVRGTAFIVDCPDADTCTFTVLEGTVEVTPTDGDPVLLDAPAALRVTAAGDTDDTLPVTGPDDDPWLARNTDLDEEVGFDPLTDPFTDGDPIAGGGGVPDSLADWTGTWTATISDPRIVVATSDWAGSTVDLSAYPPSVYIRSPDGVGQGSFTFAGAVEFTCERSSCSMKDVDEGSPTSTLRRDIDGRLVVSEGTNCGDEVPDAFVVRDVTASTFTYTETFTVSSQGISFGADCGEHATAAFEVTMTRADG